MSAAKKSGSASYYVKLLIGLFFILVFDRIVPPFGPVTPVGMQAIGIFLGVVFLVSAGFGFIIPTLFGMFGIIMSGYYNSNSILPATLGHVNTWQIITASVLCGGMATTGAGEVIAKWLISRKLFRGKPALFVGGYLLASLFMAAFVGIGGMIFMFSIMDSIFDALGESKDGKFHLWLSLVTFITDMVGTALIAVKGFPVLVFNPICNTLAEYGYEMNLATYSIAVWVFGLLFIVGAVIIMKLARVDMSSLKDFDMSKMEGMQDLRMNKQQIITSIALILGILYGVLIVVLPKGTPLHTIINKFSAGTWFMTVLALLFCVRIDGKPILNPEKAFKDNVLWGTVLCSCVFTVIGNMISAKDLGINTWLNSVLSPIFDGLSFPVFMLVVIALTAVITNVMSNTAIGIIMGTLTVHFAAGYAMDLGINPMVYAAVITMAASYAYITPAATASSAIFFTREGIKTHNKFVWGAGGVMLLYGIVLLTVVFTALSYIL